MDHYLSTGNTAEKMRLSLSYFLSLLLVLLCGNALVSARPQGPCGPPPNGPPPSGPPPSGPPPGGRCAPPQSTTAATG
ncbi:mulatexin [Drosophila innubila]|uniref:mulatexin n=1 Tax=Drosophila innubila TaxID=198719 RepID=UPI00148E1690|nr:mulatexin [Drosophila innubila]